jgi:hypothetical protein
MGCSAAHVRQAETSVFFSDAVQPCKAKTADKAIVKKTNLYLYMVSPFTAG